jgi:gas vesicle protein
MKKLKTYKLFESGDPTDQNIEKEIDKILETLIEQKLYVIMLRETTMQVSKLIEQSLPKELDQFMDALKDYEEDVFEKVDTIKNNILDGFPNMKDLAEELENGIIDIEEYLNNKRKGR